MRRAIRILFGVSALLGSFWFARAAEPSPRVATSHALIVVGLPGDAAHDALFRSTAERWRLWLVGPLGFAPAEVRVVSGSRDVIQTEADALRGRCSADDRVWVLVIGHANLDDGQAFLHLPGPDLTSTDFASLFRDLPGREQVFWITSPAAGAFVKPLSRAGRIVIAATEPDGESNETEFPLALAEIGERTAAQLDRDKDGQVSILELFESTAEAVEARFVADKRAPTEHARLDDNGDGVGTEFKPSDPPANPDGTLASKTIALSLPKPASASPSVRSENGTKSVVRPAR